MDLVRIQKGHVHFERTPHALIVSIATRLEVGTQCSHLIESRYPIHTTTQELGPNCVSSGQKSHFYESQLAQYATTNVRFGEYLPVCDFTAVRNVPMNHYAPAV